MKETVSSASRSNDDALPKDPYHRRTENVNTKAGGKKYGLIIRILISACLIGAVLSFVSLREALNAIQQANPVLILSAFLLIPLGVVLGTMRWRILLATHDVHASFWFLFGSGCVAAFVRLFLPTTIGGDAVRIYDSRRVGASTSVAFATVGLDRLLGFLSLASIAVVALLFSPEINQFPLARGLMFLAAAGLALLVAAIFLPIASMGPKLDFFQRLIPGVISRPLFSLLGSLKVFEGEHKVLARALTLSVLLQINVVTFYWLIASSLGISITFLQMFVAAPIATFTMMLPLSINGIGLRELIWVALLTGYGFDQASGLALGWIELGLFTVFGLLGGLVFAARR